jgi:Reverse transcriptase (RNA-dependent DNA polymerase)
LGFQSLSSLRKALCVKQSEFEVALDLCENGDPYDRWYEQKRSGGRRLIEHPVQSLKKVQQRINWLLQRLRLSRVFHGSYSCTSILSNAEPHASVSWFLTFDLANYYKTIRPSKVYDGLRSLHAAPDVARSITRLTTTHGRVPQGAPTSPMIAAIAMLTLARRLNTLCSRLNSALTIYGDNVCISGPRVMARHQQTFLKIAVTEGFRVRSEKTQLTRPAEDKPLPGLIIRQGRPTISDDDLRGVKSLVERCSQLGNTGIAERVCCRFRSRLGGLVNHYTWIDKEAMEQTVAACAELCWPKAYARDPCWSPQCHCSVLSHDRPSKSMRAAPNIQA